MAAGRIKNTELAAIAAAIRSKNGESTVYKPGEMAAAIAALPGAPTLQSLSVTENGSYTPGTGVDGYSSVSVNVPNSYGQSDEGKVVSNGALVAQGSDTVTQNGTVDTTLISSLVVNVSGGGGGGVYTGTTAPDDSVGSDGDVYIRSYPLPANISFVEYLQSSGTQYIDTGIYANQGTDIDVTFDKNKGHGVFGAMSSSTYANCFMMTCGDSSSQLVLAKNGGDWNSRLFSVTKSNPITISTRTVETGSNYYAVIGEYSTSVFKNATFGSFTSSPQTMILFGRNIAGTVSLGSIKIYRAKIYQDGALVADYLPALDGNGVACMYNAASGQFVYNSGTGSFTAGASASPAAHDKDTVYIKRSGTWGLAN